MYPVTDGIVLTVSSRINSETVFCHLIEFEEDFIAKHDKPDIIDIKLYLTDKICEEIFNIIDPKQKYKKCNIHLRDIYEKIEKSYCPILPLEDVWQKDFVFKHLMFEDEKEIIKWLKEYK